MKIIFDLRSVGLGNNGGSSTLIKSANTLVDLGYEVVFVDHMKNMHTWTPLKPDHIIIKKDQSNLPIADIIIATGYKSVAHTIQAPNRCGIKTHWIRAWETWQMSDKQIIESVLKAATIKLVNSICLQDKLKKYGFDSYIIRPGYDFGQIFPQKIREGKKEIIVGGLYRAGVHGKRKRTEWLIEAAKKLKSKHGNLKFWMFGSEKNPGVHLCDYYLRSPNIEDKNKFYNNVDIWMAPTMSEGLHLPPAEAMMSKCPVVSTSAELSGTQDYVIDGETGLVSKNELGDFINCVDRLIKDEKTRLDMGRKARMKILAIGDRKVNMQKLVDLIREKII